jgi:hypothetical protein
VATAISNNMTNYNASYFFVVTNCLGMTLQILKQAINDLVECEQGRVQNLALLENYLLLGGTVILGICYLLILLLLLTIDKPLNTLWEYVQIKAILNYGEVKQTLIERLVSYHQESETAETETQLVNLKSRQPIYFRHSLRYILRFSVLFAIGAIFYTVTIYVFFDEIQKYLLYRPLLSSLLLIRRIQISELMFYTLENEMQITVAGLSNEFPLFSGFNTPPNMVNELISEMGKSRALLTSPGCERLMSSSVWESIFQQLNGYQNFMQLGSYAGTTFLIQQSYVIVFNGAVDSVRSIFNYFSNVTEFITFSVVISDKINQDSSDIIILQLNKLIYFTAFSCLLLVVMYFTYFYPFLNSEIKAVKIITQVLTMLPSEASIHRNSNMGMTAAMTK